MSPKIRLFYALVSGFLLSLPWYEGFSGIFLWFAIVPLLLIEDFYYTSYQKPKREVFLYASLTFLTWNISTTWWLINATFVGACIAIMMNTFLFSLIFWFYHVTRKVTGYIIGGLALVVYWTAFEYFYLNAEISWPWLNLGNGFANNVRLVQWYEYTGTLGGTVWVLLVNMALFIIFKKFQEGISWRHFIIYISCIVILLLLPVTLSLIRFYNYTEKEDPYRIAVIQPNIDPYNDKFGGMSPEQQLDILLKQADSLGNKSIDYFVGPETAIQGYNLESEINNNWAINKIRAFLQQYPKAKFVIGSETVKEYRPGEKLSGTAHKLNNTGVWCDHYNTAVQVDTTHIVQIYHKSQLVVGVEKMPYVRHLRFLEKYALKLGGTFGSRGTQEDREVFYSHNNKCLIAPVICYESVYGEYVTGYIKNGANLIFILTNDGWWGNTPGYKQHLNYARLRAVETRRSIARSANTGISAFINQRGEIVSSLEWGQKESITTSLNANSDQTFYVRYGDYLGKWASMISAFIIVISIILFFSGQKYF